MSVPEEKREQLSLLAEGNPIRINYSVLETNWRHLIDQIKAKIADVIGGNGDAIRPDQLISEIKQKINRRIGGHGVKIAFYGQKAEITIDRDDTGYPNGAYWQL